MKRKTLGYILIGLPFLSLHLTAWYITNDFFLPTCVFGGSLLVTACIIKGVTLLTSD
jgi:hypothetical protein